MKNKNYVLGIIYLLITAVIWGGSFISQLKGGLILGSFIFVAIRCVFSCATCLIILLIHNYKCERKIAIFTYGIDIKRVIINSFFCAVPLFLSMITQQIGCENTDTAKAGLIAALEVICVPILMLIIYKRKILFITWIFIFLTMFGIMLLSINSITGINRGDIIVFISTFIYSYTVIQLPKRIEGIDVFVFSFCRMFFVAIMGLICAFIFEKELFDITIIKTAILPLLYSGVLSSGIAYTLQVLGQKNCEPVIATLIMSLEGIFAAIFGWIILGQSLNYIQIFGIFIAFISIVVVQITDN